MQGCTLPTTEVGEVGEVGEVLGDGLGGGGGGGGGSSPTAMSDFSPDSGRPFSSRPPARDSTYMRDFSPPVLRASRSLAPASSPQPQPPVLQPPSRLRAPGPAPIPAPNCRLQQGPSSLGESVRGESARGGSRVTLVYDQVLNCYFDPVSHRYFELK